MTKQTKQVELAEAIQKKLEARLHDFIKKLLDKDLAYEEDDYDEYFDEDGRVSTCSPSGCTYHKDLKFFIKNDLGRIIAQAQQEAVKDVISNIKDLEADDDSIRKYCVCSGFWDGVERAFDVINNSPQKEQE